MKGLFGWTREKVREFYIIHLVGDMKVTGKMIKNKVMEFCFGMTQQQRLRIIDELSDN